jgi:hypothetical protein
LTVGEAELLRQINIQWHDHGWGRDAYHDVMRQGVIRRLVTSSAPGVDAQRISTPQWALTAAAKYGEQAAQRIEASGVAVIGDLARLAEPPSEPSEVRADDELRPAPRVSVDTAVTAVLGAIVRNAAVTGPDLRDPAKAGASQAPPATADQPAEALGKASIAEIRREVRDRARRRVRRRPGG